MKQMKEMIDKLIIEAATKNNCIDDFYYFIFENVLRFIVKGEWYVHNCN